MSDTPRALDGIRVLDLTRILAGPTATQLLGDLGADVIKVEQPGRGDDTRGWGPPFVHDGDGNETPTSAYFLSVNRNKRSVTLDLGNPDDRKRLEGLIAESDVLIENFKAGGLAKYGLAHDDLKDRYPALVYCSISGFGQTGPRAGQAGYDFLIQAMGGIMSLTGPPDGEPTKVGVAVADVVCGLYAAVAVLAALHHRAQSGLGQHIDLSLFDTQVAWLINEGTNYLVSGERPVRRGNQHPNIVPYRTFAASDKHVVLAVGNDSQFQRWCEVAGVPGIAEDARFQTNADRVRNRDALHAIMEPIMAGRTAEQWTAALTERGVPCGPVNHLNDVFADPQSIARGLKITMPHPHGADGTVPLIANPIRMSRTPVTYRYPPPLLGEHSDDVLNGTSSDEPYSAE